MLCPERPSFLRVLSVRRFVRPLSLIARARSELSKQPTLTGSRETHDTVRPSECFARKVERAGERCHKHPVRPAGVWQRMGIAWAPRGETPTMCLCLEGPSVQGPNKKFPRADDSLIRQ